MARRLQSLEEVLPDRRYSVSEAAPMVPSPHGGHVTAETIRNRIRRGECAGEVIKAGRYRYYYLRGCEILRMAKGEPLNPQTQPLESPREASRAYARTLEELRKSGVGNV